MDRTPDPTLCRDSVPGGPDCPTPTPGATPTTVPVELPDDGVGSGALGMLDTVLGVLPWVLVALLVVAVALLLADRARRRATAGPSPSVPVGGAAPVPAPVPHPTPSSPSAAPGASPGLIRDLLTLADLATTPAVGAQVRRVLRGLGIEPLEPTPGTPLDLDAHEVVATAVSPDPAHHERVARVHRPGWLQGREVLRPAAVEIWVAGPPP